MKKSSEWINNENDRKVSGRERHLEFQRPDPMSMSPFEQRLKAQEESERFNARAKYVDGVQGTDGGYCVHKTYIEEK